MLGSRRRHTGNTTHNEATLKKCEIIPKNLQITERLRKQKSVSNYESKLSTARLLYIRLVIKTIADSSPFQILLLLP